MIGRWICAFWVAGFRMSVLHQVACQLQCPRQVAHMMGSLHLRQPERDKVDAFGEKSRAA